MGRKLRTYEDDGIVVEYDLKRCIHSAECVRGLPEVFDSDRVPWIDPARADADEIAEVIERCPTGALHYRRTDGAPAERADETNVAVIGADGPVYVRGRLRIELPGGEVLTETRAAFCRCGASGDKPFCDGSHDDAGFRDAGAVQGGRLVPLEELTVAPGEAGTGDPGVVTFSCRPDGPLLISGPLRVEAKDGETVEGAKGAFCRCGNSSTKPFCDGSHKAAGFQAPGSDA